MTSGRTPTPKHSPRARRDVLAVPFSGNGTPIIRREPDLGVKWFYSFVLETVGRNLATAGALEYAYRMGLARDAVRRAGRR